MQTQQVVTKIEIQKVRIPQELLTLSPLEKPKAKRTRYFKCLFYAFLQIQTVWNSDKQNKGAK